MSPSSFEVVVDVLDCGGTSASLGSKLRTERDVLPFVKAWGEM